MTTADKTHSFDTGAPAYELAKRFARYGRRHWLVWRTTDGSYRAARLSQSVLEAAMSSCAENEAGKPIVSCIQANTAGGINVSRALAEVWLANMRAGYFSYA